MAPAALAIKCSVICCPVLIPCAGVLVLYAMPCSAVGVSATAQVALRFAPVFSSIYLVIQSITNQVNNAIANKVIIVADRLTVHLPLVPSLSSSHAC